ncbi:MAG: type II/IV secretion system protein [Candidatus Rokubacteria bacterium]|nr:type II/IV secretion system protein [Candidatus Rokubacteria bacterium]
MKESSSEHHRSLARLVQAAEPAEPQAPKRRRADYLPLAIPMGQPEAAVEMILSRAVATGASDVHLEADADGMCVRFRIHGVLQAVGRVPLEDRAAVISRTKILSNLDIAERRLPQDGRIKLQIGQGVVDIRVAVTPSLHGESAVLRILDLNAVSLPLSRVGMPPDIYEATHALCRRPQGLIFVTGPTGSGKTSTIYGCLNDIKGPHIKIITIEDPIEYEMATVTQIAVHEKIGLTFASCLRSALRQDPDVIVVGEIRDEETARIAMQASLTGHLVFSTLHTNSAIGAIPRLIDMGVPPYLITSSVNAVIAQRLLRVSCPGCKEPWEPSAEIRVQLGLREPVILYRAPGCDRCLGTGVVGRTGVFELLTLTPALSELIMCKASEIELRRAARAAGCVPIFNAGLAKVLAGEVALEELTRVVSPEE